VALGLFLPGFLLSLFQLSQGGDPEAPGELFLFTMVYGLAVTAPGTALGALGVLWLSRRGWFGFWQTAVLAGVIGVVLFDLLERLFFSRLVDGGGGADRYGHQIALLLAMVTGLAVWAVLRVPQGPAKGE
jgi:hypothetical protein